MKKVWDYGTSTPAQRVGLIILSIGMLSYIAWIFTGYHYGYDYTHPDPWVYVIFNPDYFPERRDFVFFHLYLYFMPLGLLMTWGYKLLVKLKQWIIGKPTKKPITSSGNKLYFKDNLSAFEFATSIYPASLDINKTYFGIIRNAVLTTNDRFQYTIELANEDVPIMVYGFNDKPSTYLSLDSLVLWSCERPIINKNFYNVEATGSILATLNPEFNPNTKAWGVLQDLT